MIEINNLTNFAVDKKFFIGVAKKVLKGENRERATAKSGVLLEAVKNLSIAFVSSAEIKKLNRKYRKKNKPTDVLSFGKTLDFKSDLAEIIICPEIVKKNAREFNASLKKELAKMLIHGILHVLGYDHEKSKKQALEMEKKQEKYLLEI